MWTRNLRPALSPRYTALKQIQSRSITSQTLSPPSKPPRSRPPYGTWLLLAGSVSVGAYAGKALRKDFVKPPHPDPHSTEDLALLTRLDARIDKEFKVQVLRGKCLGVAKQLKGQEGGWKEVVNDDQAQVESLRASLAGARGLGVERIFWNQSDETLVAIIWFGPSMSGWPGVAHGGVIATQFLEKIGLASWLARGHNTSTRAEPQRMPGTGDHAKMLLPVDELDEPRDLSLSYVKPTMTEDFYVLRVSPALPLATDSMDIVPSEPLGGHHEWEATLESLDARILVKAKASFEQSSVLATIERGIDKAAGQTYEQFRQWMWPSRQQSLQDSVDR